MYKKPSSTTEKNIVSIWQEMLFNNKIGVDDNFFEIGGNSLLAQKTVAQLKKQHNQIIPIKQIYQNPTAATMAAFMEGKIEKKEFHFIKRKENQSNRDIAIIGMKVKVPGANTIEEFWDLLREGKETTTFFDKNELDTNLPQDLTIDAGYVAARGILEDPENFDAGFFGISSKMAELMDPQHRIFLELSRDLLETTGYLPAKYTGIIGVYTGCGNNAYFLNNVHSNPDKINAVGSFNVSTVSDKDYIASRTAFQLNLKGPAVSVFSACSTSLLAIANAVDSIRNNHCHVALAGGISITSPIKNGHIYQEGAILSKDGHCKPFDASSTGTVFSDGAGVILLKSLADAEKDGDYIYAVLKGIGINNDGSNKGSFTAPSAQGQASAIAMAIDDAGVDPANISYVEAHGTATPIGDPIEVEGLTLAFGEQKQKQYCAIGSVKSNFGHLVHAAGVAGTVKTILALQHKQIPASINFEVSNPHINFTESPFYVNNTLTDWKNQEKIAGVSSFGVGGTNVHIILTGYENPPAKPTTTIPCLINWSAKNENSLFNYANSLSSFALAKNESSLVQMAYTLQNTRQDFNFRSFTVATTKMELASKIASLQEVFGKTLKEVKSNITFIYPGQGAHYPQMGKGLYQQYPIFKTALDECTALISKELEEDFLPILFSDTESSKLNETCYTQPALFAIEYALTKLWLSLGVKPSSFIGHSIGEFVAAHFAGIFKLTDVVKIITVRAKIVNAQAKGSMLSVKSTLASIQAFLPPTISIAAINTTQSVVLAAETTILTDFAAVLDTKSIAYKFLDTNHAFHSTMMDSALEPFSKIFKRIELGIPKIPIVSTVTVDWLKDAEATDIDYWIEHLRTTVNFAGAVNTIQEENTVLLEVGPGAALSSFAKQTGIEAVVGGLKKPENETEEQISFLTAIGNLWLNGIDIHWKNLYQHKVNLDLSLPTYAFQKKRHWVEPINHTYATTASISESRRAIIEAYPIVNQENALIHKIKEILEKASGVELEHANPNLNFIELGIDSLLLTQVAINLKKEFEVPITFRLLSSSVNTLKLLSTYLNTNLSEKQKAEFGFYQNKEEAVSQKSEKNSFQLSKEEAAELKKPFGATPKIDRDVVVLNQPQQEFINAFIKKYNFKTAKSKQYAQKNRPHMADPRVVSGFKPTTKEIVYPIVVKKSKGSKLWDIDDNEYIDALNGFGSNLLGYQPDFLTKAIKNQIDKGYEIGPQHELAAEVTKLICELTGFERSALCNTGSEAVLGAMRIARSVSGKTLIVTFNGSYHGINDEVLIRGTKNLKSFPAASGILPEAVQNMLVLDYGTDESLKIIAERSNEIAAVLVEPVQSRNPELLPTVFLKELRKITQQKEVVLIFDEVITGFRSHPGGIQALLGIKADIATYGKVIGGGLPIGAISGIRKYMDALDGGFWQFGDDSMPEVGVTYFAGTFVRHPMALAAAKASLQHFKTMGPSLQTNLNNNTQYLANALNVICTNYQIPIYIAHFSSLWKIKFKEDYPYYNLIFSFLREKGVHIWDGFPCFLTTAHSQKDIDFIIEKFEKSVEELLSAKLLPTEKDVWNTDFLFSDMPPLNEAKLGIDENGNPGWFLQDKKTPGNYLKIEY